MELIGEYKGYQLFKNNDGFIEAYKTIGLQFISSDKIKMANNINRIVTNAKTLKEVIAQLDRKFSKKIKVKKEDTNQLRVSL